MDFYSLSRRELQTLCKQNKIPANLSNVAMADALSALEVVEGLKELTKSDTASLKTPGKQTVSSSVARTSTRTRRIKEEPESVKLASTRTRRGATETPAPRASSRRAPLAQSTQVKVKGETSEVKEKSKTAVANAYSTRRSTRLVEKMLGELTIGEKENLCGTEANMEEELQRGFSDNMENSFDAVEEETKVTPVETEDAGNVVAQPMDDSVSTECILQVEQMNMLMDTCDTVKEQKICTDEINKEAMVEHNQVVEQQMEDSLGNEKVVGDRILDNGEDGQDVKIEKYEDDEQVKQREYTDTTESFVAPDAAVAENEVSPCSVTTSITLDEPGSPLDVKPVSEGSTLSSRGENMYCPEKAHCTDVEKLNDDAVLLTSDKTPSSEGSTLSSRSENMYCPEKAHSTDVEKLNDDAVLFTSDKAPTPETAIDVLMGGLTCAPKVVAEEEKLSSDSTMSGDEEDYSFVSDSEDLEKPGSAEMGLDGTAKPDEVILKPSTAFHFKLQSDNKENNMIETPLEKKSLNKLRKLVKEKLALGNRVDMENRGSSVQIKPFNYGIL